MGLDMYLEAERYLSAYDFYDDHAERKQKLDSVIDNAGFPANMLDPETPSATVSINVAYWRKANAIHQWFVDNVQDGVDECQRSWVPKEKLIELRDLCNEVIADPRKAPELLPTQAGFFFGSTTYDEWYYQDLKSTVEQINRVLAAGDADVNFDIYYRASW